MGINTISAYVTRSSMELMELCKAMGGEPQTISGLSGIGLDSPHETCSPVFSRRFDAYSFWRNV
jgi:glycerol-3-phosphate dehydrogenase